jgi:PAS domain S-box-containing protein
VTPSASPRRRLAAVLAGLALIGLVAGLDVAYGPTEVFITIVVVGPFLTALAAERRDVIMVGALAVAVTIASGWWNDSIATGAQAIRIVGVLGGAVLAVLSAQVRSRDLLAQRRLGLLAAVAEVADGELSLRVTVERIADLLVPRLADLAVIDAMQGGTLSRIAVRGEGPEPPTTAIQAIPDAAELRSPSSVVVPLRARGRVLGALTLGLRQSGRTFREGDRAFAGVLAGRVALALDNAGLFSELESMEAQLTAALGSLSDAVTVQNREGRLVYVNDAAARTMGFADAATVRATPPSRLVSRYDIFDEAGRPVDITALPGRRVLNGEAAPPLVVRSVHRGTGEERWQLIKASPVLDREGRPYLAVNVIEDITDVKRAEFGQRLLVEAGALLAASLEYEDTLQQVAELAVPELADWCGVSIPDASGEIRQVAVAHVDPAKVAFAREYNRRYPVRVEDPDGAAEVLRTGASQLVTQIPDELLEAVLPDPDQLELIRSIGMRSVMLVPMMAAGRPIGVVTFVSAESGRTFTEADLALAEELGRRAGTAVANARLYAERTHIARTLQTGLLPDAVPDIPGLALATLYRPAGEENWVGGDFYDAFAVTGGWMVVVGDVAGRGPEAAALTALARHTLRTAATIAPDPLSALTHLNLELAARPETSLVTVGCALVTRGPDGDSMRARIACAGHPPALLVRGGEVQALGRFGPMLGAFRASTWDPVDVDLYDGDVLILYTDGVIDTRGRDGRFGEERLWETVASAVDAGDAVRRIDGALRAFESGEQADDTAILAIRCGTAPAVPGVVHHRLELPGGTTAPRRARRAVATWLAEELASDRLYDVRVLVSELVTNAVRHAGADEGHVIGLDVVISPVSVRVSVSDPGPGFIPVADPRPRPEGGGAGLLLVDRLSSRWAVEPGRPAVVWFELDRPAASAAA